MTGPFSLVASSMHPEFRDVLGFHARDLERVAQGLCRPVKSQVAADLFRLNPELVQTARH